MYQIISDSGKRYEKLFPSQLVALAALMRSCRRQKINCYISSQHGDTIKCIATKGNIIRTYTIAKYSESNHDHDKMDKETTNVPN